MSETIRSMTGGQANQAGISYQNSIAASLLFEMLVGASDILAVTIESREVVDDIVVDRRARTRRYYQVKSAPEPRWTVARLVSTEILAGFVRQYQKDGGACELVLASPQTTSEVGRLGDTSRASSSVGLFTQQMPSALRDTWSEIIQTVGTPQEAFSYLQSHYEECWHLEADRIRDEVFGRHNTHPYSALKNSLWSALCAIAAEPSSHGRPITRVRLLGMLEQRVPGFRSEPVAGFNIQSIRQSAGTEWYIHRHEEREFLARLNDFVQGKHHNLIVMGDGGTGKSSLFDWLCRYVSSVDAVTLIRVTPAGDEIRDVLREINVKIRQELRLPQHRDDEMQLPALDTLAEYVRIAADRNQYIIIAIDSFESFFASLTLLNSQELAHRARYSFFEAVRRTLNSRRVMWVLFARSEYFFLLFPTEEDRAATAFSWIRMTEFEYDQADLLITRLGALSSVVLDTTARETFIKHTGFPPQKIVLAYLALIDKAVANQAGDAREHEAIHLNSSTILEWRPWESGFRHDIDSLDGTERAVVIALASLMETRSGGLFSIAEIRTRLAGAAENDLAQLEDVLHRLQERRCLLRQPERGRFVLYHQNFARFVLMNSGGTADPEDVATNERLKTFLPALRHQLGNAAASLHMAADRLANEVNRLDPDTTASGRTRELLDNITATTDLFQEGIRAFEFLTLPGATMRTDRGTRILPLLRHTIQQVVGYRPNTEMRVNTIGVPDEEVLVRGDAAALSVSLFNVLDNATKYSVDGSPVEVVVLDERDLVHIDVTNRTLSTAPDELASVFQPGYRGRTATTLSSRGLGMGLWLVRSLMHSLGGSVSFRPAAEEGPSRQIFTMRLTFLKWSNRLEA